MALNEQAMESYIRMFLENQMITQEFYLRYVLLSHIDQAMSRLNISVELFEVKCSLSLFVPHTHTYRESFLRDTEVSVYHGDSIDPLVNFSPLAFSSLPPLSSLLSSPLSSPQRLLVLQTLVSGLDFISFDLSMVSH